MTVITLVAIGMLPCLGWVQWFGSFAAAAAIIVGLLGLLFDRDELGMPQSRVIHILALVVGLLGGGLGALRCLGGGGIF